MNVSAQQPILQNKNFASLGQFHEDKLDQTLPNKKDLLAVMRQKLAPNDGFSSPTPFVFNKETRGLKSILVQDRKRSRHESMKFSLVATAHRSVSFDVNDEVIDISADEMQPQHLKSIAEVLAPKVIDSLVKTQIKV